MCFFTCAEQQQDFHAQVLFIGHLQPDKLITDLQHLLTLVVHEGHLHSLAEKRERDKKERRAGGEQGKTEGGEAEGEDTHTD